MRDLSVSVDNFFRSNPAVKPWLTAKTESKHATNEITLVMDMFEVLGCFLMMVMFAFFDCERNTELRIYFKTLIADIRIHHVLFRPCSVLCASASVESHNF